MTVLPDSSIWVDYFRGPKSGVDVEMERLLDSGNVVVCGPVLAEILAGTDPGQRDDLWLALGSLPWAELNHAAWRVAGEIANDLRRGGRSLPLTDVVIASAAVASGAELWTHDADFETIRQVLPELQLR